MSVILLARPVTAASAVPGPATFAVSPEATSAARATAPRTRLAPVPAPAVSAAVQVARIDVAQSLLAVAPFADAQAAVMPAATPAAAGSCDLTPQVQDALRRRDDIVRQLANGPVASRPVTTAMVVWNAGWMADNGPDAMAGVTPVALAAIRRIIVQSVADAPADCRDQRQAGPRFIYLPGNAGRTVVLAVGSGDWSWHQLAPDAGPPSPAQDMPIVGQGLAPVPTSLPAAVMAARPAVPDPTPGLNAMLASLLGRHASARTPYDP